MKHTIDFSTWNRKEQFEFFNSMSDPYTGIVANVNCKKALEAAKEMNSSFWLYYLHKSLMAVNQTEEFRYRIENEEVVCYDAVHAGSTLDNIDKTFSFVFLNYHEQFTDFQAEALPEVEKVRNSHGINFGPEQQRLDCIHYTTMPWTSFTALKHARHDGFKNSCPKISFGKYFEDNGKLLLPVSVEVNHSLMDGRQIGEFYERFETLMNE